MSMHESHPDSEQLDRLRAGLLDDEPALKAEIETHLDECNACQKRYNWSGALQPGKLPVDAADEQLDQIRRRALESPATRHTLLPIAVAAALALVAVILVKPSLQNSQPETQLAQTPAEEAPVLYEDLDFYLWLADHTEESDSNT